VSARSGLGTTAQVLPLKESTSARRSPTALNESPTAMQEPVLCRSHPTAPCHLDFAVGETAVQVMELWPASEHKPLIIRVLVVITAWPYTHTPL